MNRLGRGYSFEALRAKILFTEGAHNKTKPKFRRREAAPTVGYAMFEMVGRASFGQDQHEVIEAAKNYGADISTLTRLIEEGKL